MVHELLDVRSASTSDRPPNHFIEITTGGLNLVLARYSNEWKLIRRAVHEILTLEACMNHLPIQRAEPNQLMYDLLKQPEVGLTAYLSISPY